MRLCIERTQILEGLQWMHEALSRGHGSIKHCNIVVTEGGMSRIGQSHERHAEASLY